MTKARKRPPGRPFSPLFRPSAELHLTVPGDESKFPNLRYRNGVSLAKDARKTKPRLAGKA